MRVLYLSYHPCAISETYIRNEIEWMQRSGAEIFMLAHKPHVSEHPLPFPKDHLQWGGKISEAVHRFNIDIIHAHWLDTLGVFHLDELANVQRPITVRGHSFDFSPEKADLIASFDAVKKVWLFPHFAAAATTNLKIQPLNAHYAGSLYQPGTPNGKVVRATAGLGSKGIANFVKVARLCPETPFELIITRAIDHPDYPDTLAAQGPPNLQVRVNLEREEVVKSFAEASWYLAGIPAHSFAMPVSIAEAMGSGVTPIMPDLPAAHAYTGEAAYYYRNPEEAADVIKNKVLKRQAAIERAKLYTDDAVLPEVLTEWKNLVRTA